MTEEQTLKAYCAAIRAKRYKVATALAVSLKRFNSEPPKGSERVNTLVAKIQQECKP